RYGSKIERRLRAIKESTEAAKLIVANADDEQD
ncbi:phage protein Gp27 family protein, partial [Kingella kingae]